MKRRFLDAFNHVATVSSPGFRADLEGRLMKSQRKGAGAVKPLIHEMLITPLSPESSVFFGSKGPLGLVAKNGTDFNLLKDIAHNGPRFEKAAKYEEPDYDATNWTSEPIIGDTELVNWLIDAKRLVVESYPHARKNVPAIVQIALYNPEQKTYSNFVWNKEMGGSMLGYVTLLFPVYAFDPRVSKLRVMAPLEHLALWLSTKFQCPPIYSVKYIDTLFEGRGARALEGLIRKYVEAFGDVVPSSFLHDTHAKTGAKLETGRHIAFKNARYFGSHTLVVDHSSVPGWKRDVPVENMIKMTNKASQAIRGLHVPATGSKRIARKHFIAGPNGLPEFCKEIEGVQTCQAHRPGRNRSLLMRSGNAVKCRIAILKYPSIQCFITPSGIERTQLEIGVFLPEVAYEATDGFNMSAQHSWTGNTTYVWVSPNAKQDAKPVGKFVCPLGSRFEPMETQQWTSSDGKNIDILYSTAELIDKQLLGRFMAEAKPETITAADGTQIQCMVLEYRLYRSATASENIKPRRPKHWSVTGFTGLMLRSALINNEVKHRSLDRKMWRRGEILMQIADRIPHFWQAGIRPEEVKIEDFTPAESIETEGEETQLMLV